MDSGITIPVSAMLTSMNSPTWPVEIVIVPLPPPLFTTSIDGAFEPASRHRNDSNSRVCPTEFTNGFQAVFVRQEYVEQDQISQRALKLPKTSLALARKESRILALSSIMRIDGMTPPIGPFRADIRRMYYCWSWPVEA